MLRAGIVGLPNVGKSTLFNALTSSKNAESANYPFCTIEPNVGVVSVPDDRLWVLKDIVKTNNVIPTAIEFVDIAGLVKGASKGEGLGNQFLHNIREVDAIIQVVRCFDDDNTIHVSGKINPLDDVETINTELALADMASIDKQKSRILKSVKSGDKDAKLEYSLLERIEKLLESASFINTDKEFDEEEKEIIKRFQLMTTKPVIYAANVSETDLATGNDYVKSLKDYADSHNAEVVIISAKIEQELVDLGKDEAKAYLSELGVETSGIERMIQSVYKLLKLSTFFTAGEKEVRAWTIKENTKAPKAAGVIHTDFEKGFIKAEIVSYDDFVRANGWNGAKEKGVARLEGKDYQVQDGDVVFFKFNV